MKYATLELFFAFCSCPARVAYIIIWQPSRVRKFINETNKANENFDTYFIISFTARIIIKCHVTATRSSGRQICVCVWVGGCRQAKEQTREKKK